MSINNFTPHLLVLSEDNAYRQIATGFISHFAVIHHNVRINKIAKGGLKVLKLFSRSYISGMRTYRHRHILLLFDCDESIENYNIKVQQVIPEDIKDRVFFLSSFNEVENIKDNLGRGKIGHSGKKLAESCYNATFNTHGDAWQCPQLKHNQSELERLAHSVRPFLFNSLPAADV